jgi:hypothetical protein
MTEARPGKGYFQWSAGGWFGAQIGSSLWILLLGILYLAKSVTIGLCVIFCFLMNQLFCTLLWRRRAKTAPHRAIQLMLLFSGILALVSIILIDSSSGFADLEAVFPSIPLMWYAVLLIYPLMMSFFYLLERRALH